MQNGQRNVQDVGVYVSQIKILHECTGKEQEGILHFSMHAPIVVMFSTIDKISFFRKSTKMNIYCLFHTPNPPFRTRRMFL